MAYIGRQNLGGAYRQLDDISSGFDGSDTTHTMQVNSANVTVGDVNQIILSLGGVIQKPGTDFTVSGSVLTFTTAPAANTSFFAVLLGSDNGGTVTPTDNSVSTGKIVADAITSAKIADDAVTGDHIASSGAFAIGAANTASSIAGVTFYVGQSGSIYTSDVSGTDDSAENNTAFGAAAMDAITTGDNNMAFGENALGANTTGSDNIAIGLNAIDAADTEGSNIAIGRDALGGSVAGGEYNVAIGNYAGDALTSGDSNVFIGYQAGSGNTTGQRGVAIGYQAMDNAATSSTGNICIGYHAGRAIDSGEYNCFIGYTTGQSNTTGSANVGIGQGCLPNPDTESNNIAIGMDTLAGSIAGGEYNIAIGRQSLDALTSGDSNNALGYQTLSACADGELNNAFGDRALTAVNSGDKNVGVGQQAGFGITSGSNNICIGFDSGRASSPSGNITTGSNTLCLGDDNISNFFCADTSISSSDKRDKTDVTNFTAGLDFIEKMQPVTYKWDKRSWYSDDLSVTPDGSKKATETNVGFLAQDVETLEKEIGFANDKNDMLFVNLTEDNERYGMKYERLVTVLVNAVKELSAEVKKLKEDK